MHEFWNKPVTRWQLAVAMMACVFAAGASYVASNRAADRLGDEIRELIPLLKANLEATRQPVTQTNDVDVGILTPSRSVERAALIQVLRDERERDGSGLYRVGSND